MRGGLTARVRAPGRTPFRPSDPLQATLDPRLNARLERGSARPVALGLSGGSDSLALLHLAADWCARAERPLLALTVDHGLSPESTAWTARAGAMAAQAGAAWRALGWTGPKPSVGLPAAARTARHALLAEAARAAGAAVVLLAHTADDAAETEALRADAAPAIGRLREWAPSPAWPEGRGVFLLRPLLGTSRAELQAWLRARALGWLDDPANADLRFARARLRKRGGASLCAAPEASSATGFGEALADGRVRLPLDRLVRDDPAARLSLAAAIACAAGSSGTPRGDALDRLLDRLSGGDCLASSATAISATTTISTLGGARVESAGGTVTVGRDLGRRGPQDVVLPPGGGPRIWDGRFEAWAAEPGWRVGVALGRRARLPDGEREELHRLPPALRAAHPVFLRDGGAVRLCPAGVALRPLVSDRFAAAVGRVTREADLPLAGVEPAPS